MFVPYPLTTPVEDNAGEIIVQAEVTKASSEEHIGGWVTAPSGVIRIVLNLIISAITVPDAQDNWVIYIEKALDSAESPSHIIIAGYFVDTENEGDLTSLTGDPNRGGFRTTGQFQAIIDNPGYKIRAHAVARDQNSDADMGITFSILGYGEAK